MDKHITHGGKKKKKKKDRKKEKEKPRVVKDRKNTLFYNTVGIPDVWTH